MCQVRGQGPDDYPAPTGTGLARVSVRRAVVTCLELGLERGVAVGERGRGRAVCRPPAAS